MRCGDIPPFVKIFDFATNWVLAECTLLFIHHSEAFAQNYKFMFFGINLKFIMTENIACILLNTKFPILQQSPQQPQLTKFYLIKVLLPLTIHPFVLVEFPYHITIFQYYRICYEHSHYVQ